MFHVIRYAGFPGPGTTIGIFDTKAEAELAARQAACEFQNCGFSQEEGFWWGRDDGEMTVRFLVVAK